MNTSNIQPIGAHATQSDLLPVSSAQQTKSGVMRIPTSRGILRLYKGQTVPLNVCRSGLAWKFEQRRHNKDGTKVLLPSALFPDKTYGSDLLSLDAAIRYTEALMLEGAIDGKIHHPRRIAPAAAAAPRPSLRKRFFTWLAGA